MTVQHSTLLVLLVTVTLTLTGCDLLGSDDDSDTSIATAGVYVANQGNFGDGNGSVTIFDPETEQSQPTAVSDLNSTVQGIAVRDTSLFVLANSAARIDVFSTDGPTQTAQLTDLTGPRYVTFVGTNTAFVTDQSFGGSSAIQALDLSGNQPQLAARIPVEGTPDGITAVGDRFFASLGAFDDTTLVATATAGEESIENIDIDCASRYVVADRDEDVFALCSDAAEAVILDGNTGGIQSRLSLPDTAESAFNVGQPASFAPEPEELYVATDSGILRIDTAGNTVSTTINVDAAEPIGAVAYDDLRQELYVAHVPNFTERGTVTIHTRSGEQTGSFDAGIAPTYIDFRRAEE